MVADAILHIPRNHGPGFPDFGVEIIEPDRAAGVAREAPRPADPALRIRPGTAVGGCRGRPEVGAFKVLSEVRPEDAGKSNRIGKRNTNVFVEALPLQRRPEHWHRPSQGVFNHS